MSKLEGRWNLELTQSQPHCRLLKSTADASFGGLGMAVAAAMEAASRAAANARRMSGEWLDRMPVVQLLVVFGMRGSLRFEMEAGSGGWKGSRCEKLVGDVVI